MQKTARKLKKRKGKRAVISEAGQIKAVAAYPATLKGERIAALSSRSSYVENVLQHSLVARLSQALWQRSPLHSLQVFRSEVDDSGFDLILGLNNQIRYVQLKQSHDQKIPPHVSVRQSFAEMKGSCVVIMFHSLVTLEITNVGFLGGRSPAERMLSLDTFKASTVAGRRSAAGKKKIRNHYRNVPVSLFSKNRSVEELLELLFPL